MKHLKYVSKETPVRAFAIDLGKDEHPDIIDSIQGFLADPIDTLNLHLKKAAC